MLKRMGFTPCDGCQSMQRQMDVWGPKESMNHYHEILASMRAGAADLRSNPLHIPFSEWGARKLIAHACK